MKFKNIVLAFFAVSVLALVPCAKCFASDNSAGLRSILNPDADSDENEKSDKKSDEKSDKNDLD